MPAFNYGFKPDLMTGQMNFVPIINRNRSGATTNQTTWQPQQTGYTGYGQPGAVDQFAMTNNYGFGGMPNLGYNGFGTVPNAGGFNAAGYGNTGFQPTAGSFGSQTASLQGPGIAMYGSPEELTAKNNTTFNNLLSSMPNSFGILKGLDLPGIFGSGDLTNAVAQQGLSLQGGSPFMQAQPGANFGQSYNTAATVGYGQPAPYGAQYGAGAFNQQYQAPFNPVQYQWNQSAQGYYGQASAAFGYQPSPFQQVSYQSGPYQQPPVGFQNYANAQPYYQQPGAFGQQGYPPEPQDIRSAASVGGFKNTPLGSANARAGLDAQADIAGLLTKADRNLVSAQRITNLLDNNGLSASLKSTTASLNNQLDGFKNMDFNDIQSFDLNAFMRGLG